MAEPDDFIQDFTDSHKGLATLQLYGDYEGEVAVCFFSVPENSRREGHGSVAFRLLTKLADKHGVTLFLEVSPYADGPGLDKDQLIRFYRGFGFVGGRELEGYMWREPNGQAHELFWSPVLESMTQP